LVIYVLGIILGVFLLIFIVPKLLPDTDLSLDGLHERNMNGKLDPEEGFMHNGIYSFVRYDGLWYTRVSTPNGATQFNIPFHFSPTEVADVPLAGSLNYSALDAYKNFFVTFDPEDDGLNYIGVSIGEADQILIKVFGKGVVPACTKNLTAGCTDRPIVDCEATKKVPVFYFAHGEEENVLFLNNCIIVTGTEEGLFKATDRMLYHLLNIA